MTFTSQEDIPTNTDLVKVSTTDLQTHLIQKYKIGDQGCFGGLCGNTRFTQDWRDCECVETAGVSEPLEHLTDEAIVQTGAATQYFKAMDDSHLNIVMKLITVSGDDLPLSKLTGFPTDRVIDQACKIVNLLNL